MEGAQGRGAWGWGGMGMDGHRAGGAWRDTEMGGMVVSRRHPQQGVSIRAYTVSGPIQYQGPIHPNRHCCGALRGTSLHPCHQVPPCSAIQRAGLAALRSEPAKWPCQHRARTRRAPGGSAGWGLPWVPLPLALSAPPPGCLCIVESPAAPDDKKPTYQGGHSSGASRQGRAAGTPDETPSDRPPVDSPALMKHRVHRT